ncbi:MAG: amidase [Pseudomonadota bacterium]
MKPYPSLTGLADAYTNGETTPAEVTDAHLARIAALDPEIGAYQAVHADTAREAADAATKAIHSGHRIGPFHGIPFALKDICELEGQVTTAGSAAWADRVSSHTGTVARRLIQAGGILLGKTKTVEFAYGGWGTNQRMGTPKNPWDLATHRAPGGSSSGSGAAVAAGLAVCAVGTDTGGSVRIPAAFCGITGLKTTEGQVPTDGIIPLSHTLDTPGPLARSVADALVMYEVMAGREAHLTARDLVDGAGRFAVLTEGVMGLRLGTLTDAEREACTPEVLAGYDAACARLGGLGAHLAPFDMPTPFARTASKIGRLMSAEAWYHHQTLYGDPDAPMDEDVRPRMLFGEKISAAEYLGILDARRAEQARMAQAMSGLDAILTPTATRTAPPLDEINQGVSPAHFTRTFNYLAMCGLSVPTGLAADGLPTSLQIACRGGDEYLALRIGAALEAAQGSPPNPAL